MMAYNYDANTVLLPILIYKNIVRVAAEEYKEGTLKGLGHAETLLGCLKFKAIY